MIPRFAGILRFARVLALISGGLLLGSMSAQAEGTHVLRSAVLGCKSVEMRDAIRKKLHEANPVSAYIIYRQAGSSGDCRQLLRGDEVFLVSRRSTEAICVRYAGSNDCYWIEESILRRKR